MSPQILACLVLSPQLQGDNSLVYRQIFFYISIYFLQSFPYIFIVCYSLVFHFSQRGIENLLEWHAQWLEVLGFSEAQGRWFYALLACLEKPLTPESCSQIRHIAMMCAKIRASLVSVPLSHLLYLLLRMFYAFSIFLFIDVNFSVSYYHYTVWRKIVQERVNLGQKKTARSDSFPKDLESHPISSNTI